VTLAADLAAAPRPTGDATLLERETGAPGHASINVWDLYTDDGRYFFSQTEAGLPAQAKEPDITVTHGAVDGQPTLTLTAGAAELGCAGIDKANPTGKF
jgi:hypothetical protein